MKLEEGMYVRSIDGLIRKITKISEKTNNAIVEHEMWNEIFTTDKEKYLDKNVILKPNLIVKASHNIIDLIEEGDYVNGYKVSYKGNDYKPFVQCDYTVQVGTTNHYRFYEEAIYSIVTKEQFESVSYKVVKE